ncbi:MAG TPA: L,D-transpeptidase family protein [Piscinibacter sp.]|uniref:L,D-transpeptidase family protein n=1 Tax=Piscinibacter sp. TaxID=1903157 RepID=UPI002C64B2CC|nr:L,D-transpeptidase family protein [Piscinibacter sp.]HNK16961.1 L,D-transpeptidase family protein [Piscinibacter sp.]
MRRRELLAGAFAALGASALRAAEPQPVWSEALQREARSILDGAASEGLDPADYRAGPVEAAFARYLHDLHLGRVRARDLGFGVTVPVQDGALVAQALQDGIAAGRLASAVERLTPPLAQYRQLREMLARYRRLASGPAPGTLKEQLVAFGDLAAEADVNDEAVKRFQARHGLEADGVIGRATTAALAVPPARRVRQIELAMERLRWLPQRSGRPLIAINIPMFRLWAWDADAAEASPALAMNVIVGRAVRTQTPVFADEMTHLIFRPYWNVPRSILQNEVLPAIERDPGYLARHDMEMVPGADGGAPRVRQRPGAKNSLGLVKFIFPNDADVYLHGTPARELFARSRRDFSHGCVRVADPPALALWLLKDQPAWTREAIEAAMNGTRTQQVNLSAPVPVLLYYLTALVSPDDGLLHFPDDLYGHDAALERRLAARRR